MYRNVANRFGCGWGGAGRGAKRPERSRESRRFSHHRSVEGEPERRPCAISEGHPHARPITLAHLYYDNRNNDLARPILREKNSVILGYSIRSGKTRYSPVNLGKEMKANILSAQPMASMAIHSIKFNWETRKTQLGLVLEGLKVGLFHPYN